MKFLHVTIALNCYSEFHDDIRSSIIRLMRPWRCFCLGSAGGRFGRFLFFLVAMAAFRNKLAPFVKEVVTCDNEEFFFDA